MENLEQEIKADAEKAIKVLTANTKKAEDILKLQNEYKLNDRKSRTTQVDAIQKDKVVGEGEKRKTVTAVKIPIPFQKKIVSTSVAFEVGEPVTLVPTEKNNLSDFILQLWKTNRIDDKIQKLKVLQKSETQGAIQFYMKEVVSGSFAEKFLTFIGMGAQKKELKANILENKDGIMTPYFDAYKDMTAFVWQFTRKNADDKDVSYTWIWDEKNVYKCSDESGKFGWVETVPHGFDRIPIVYTSQDQPEWYDVQTMIDRIEVSMSKLGASNDYSGHPLLLIYGEVLNAPEKDEDGKAFVIPKRINEEGKEIMGDVKFLTNVNAPESVNLELTKLEDYIYSISNTPNLSLNNMKSIGNISGVAIKLMFLDSILKAKLNEGDNRTMIERIVNIMISGTITTTNTAMSTLSGKTFFDVLFNSILPDDLETAVTIASGAKSAGIMSTKTAVEYLGMNDDTEGELALIQGDSTSDVQP